MTIICSIGLNNNAPTELHILYRLNAYDDFAPTELLNYTFKKII